MNEHLKPCPFCGSSEIQLTAQVMGMNVAREDLMVQCMDCDAIGPQISSNENESKHKAIEAWNKRA